ncbi:hypothetical protein [Luteibaculum oceani]|uniref:Uncharacterized protein n=1 Tax=Luteibaculum oceani TaxID=1294296 RepID=A0A5C6V5K9_9FLAO|nr:hypothetical protein [Luteibaculum oceani]TXC78955.1 hypothetical protein FRX97_07000 [Luteibaculum oceani]
MEENKIGLALNVAKIGIIALGIIFVLMILGGNDGMVGSALTLTYVALAASAIAALGFGIYLFLTNIKNNKTGIISLGVFAAIILIAYATASSDIPAIKQQVSEGTVKMVGGGIVAFYILLIGAVGSIVYAEVSKLFK